MSILTSKEVPKIIFLDIDGVLNSHNFWNDKSQAKRYDEVGHPMNDIDPKAVESLNYLIRETGAKVVISSSWRVIFSDFKIAHVLGWAGFIGEVIGSTPHLHCRNGYGSIPRGYEIDTWLREHYTYNDVDNVRYVIIDDDSDMLLHQAENFIHVDAYFGMSNGTAYRAARKLNRK